MQCQHSAARLAASLLHQVHNEDCHGSGRAVQALQMEGVIATAAHCDVTSKAEVEALIGHTVQQVRCHSNPN